MPDFGKVMANPEDAIVPDFGKVMANPVEPIACRFRSTGHINTVNVRYVAVDVSA